MKTRIRSTVAALVLLSPVAATWAAAPAATASRPAATAPSISNMSINSDAGLAPGATLRLQVQATQGARAATVALGEGGVTVPLAQQSPGKYTGTYVVRRRDQIDPTQMMTARVTFGERSYTRQFHFPAAFQALALGAAPEANPPERRDRARDERSPNITDLLPANGERIGTRGRARVGAHLSDDGSGVDPASVRLRLNGRDVTEDARISPDEVLFRGDLEPGRYSAEVSVRDQAGNRTVKTWSFDVAPAERVGGGPLPLMVTSHRNNAVVDANGNVALQGRTAPFANVRVQVDAVADLGGARGLTQPVADQTVQADREGNFGVLVSPRGLPLPGIRYEVRLTASSGNQTTAERLSLLARQG
jgi:hypothetical protein